MTGRINDLFHSKIHYSSIERFKKFAICNNQTDIEKRITEFFYRSGRYVTTEMRPMLKS